LLDKLTEGKEKTGKRDIGDFRNRIGEEKACPPNMEMTKEGEQIGRRGFLTRLAMGIGLVASYGTGGIYVLQFLLPRKKKTNYRRLLVTSLAKLPKGGGKTFKDLAGREIVLVNTEEGLKALSTICPHLECKVYWEPDNGRFFCPCHDGVFDVNGNVVSGPPDRALDSFKVEVDENDNVFVMVKET